MQAATVGDGQKKRALGLGIKRGIAVERPLE